jgi:MFS family permease
VVQSRVAFRPASLDALNFLLADVRGALGPYLNVFLVTQQHWSQSSVGLVTMVGGLVGLAVQTPIGAAIDATHSKRGLIVLALVVLSFGAITIYALPGFWPVMITNAVMAVVGDVFGPAVAALTLGLYVRRELARRMGRNSAFDHAGNIAIAAAAGVVGWALSQRAVFLLVPFFATLAIVSVLTIPAGTIDHERARGADDGGNAPERAGPTSGWRVLLGCRPLLIFGLCTVLFHLANAPLLPLVGQKLALSHRDLATAMMSACIIAAELIMLPIAVVVGRTADRIGRKPILLIGFAVLPVRAMLYIPSDQAWWLVGVQLLDGIGAGVLGAITPLLIADLMRGTGRYNLAQGAIATLQGIGASSSGLLAGEIVDHLGYSPAFLASAVVALVAFLVLALALPESAEAVTAKPPRMSEVRFRRRALMLSAQARPGAVRIGSGPGSERGEE